jgi:hypothetical protein
MATDAMTLPDDRRDAGMKLLALVDGVGFDAVGGGWGYTDETALWRFYLFTEMVDEKGPLWIWERLLKAFHKLSLPDGMTPLDVMIASPNEWLYRSNLVRAETSPPFFTYITVREDLGLSGYGIDRMWLLRANPEQAFSRRPSKRAAALAGSARKFDLKVRQLMAA